MTMSPSVMVEVDSILEGMTRKIWDIPSNLPRAGLHAPPEELGLDILTNWEAYCGTAICSWTHILNDEGLFGVTTRASLRQASMEFKHMPLELVFHTHNG